MFDPNTKRIKEIADSKKDVIHNLEGLLNNKVFMYIDYANVRPWSEKLGWHIDLKRFKQFLDSFNTIEDNKLYYGTLVGDKVSKQTAEDIKRCGYTLVTKPVKLMNIPIDISSIPIDTPTILNSFVRKALLMRLDIETVTFLNNKLKRLNDDGILYIEDRKCNFDVEMGVDMLLDFERKEVDTFVFMSGDSDFADPVKKLLDSGKKVILFATAGRIASELSDMQEHGLIIFDIKKIAKFICWKREMSNMK